MDFRIMIPAALSVVGGWGIFSLKSCRNHDPEVYNALSTLSCILNVAYNGNGRTFCHNSK